MQPAGSRRYPNASTTPIAHDIDDTILVRIAEAVFVDAIDITGADQVRYIVSENTRHLRPGSANAGFLVGTALPSMQF